MKAIGLPEVWGSHHMVLRQKPKGGCQHKFKNGEQCGRKIDGQGSWRYCTACREAAQQEAQEAKRERDRQRSAERREGDDKRAEDNYYHWLYDHDLTDNKLKSLFEDAETLQEEYSHMDDFHEDAVEEFNDILWSLLNPPDNILSTALAAEEQTLYLLNRLKRQQEVFPNRLTDRLIVYAEELQRASGKRVSPRAFTELSGKAKKVLELWREQKEDFRLYLCLIRTCGAKSSQIFGPTARTSLFKHGPQMAYCYSRRLRPIHQPPYRYAQTDGRALGF